MTIMNFSFCEFLRKIPDVSRIPNLEILTLDYCENLVEVHPSVGFLDKLVSLRLGACSNLKSFPRSLKIRSLKLLCLRDCSRLKNFPEIECQMECLENINLAGAGIKELPSSIGYLTGLKTLNLNGCTHLMDLPYSIHKWQHLEILSIGDMDRIILPCLGLPYSNYQLCHLEHLSLSGCSKVTEFLKMVKDTIQSMPTVVSTEESKISSVLKLLQFSPSTNTSDSNDGYYLVVFSKLRVLDLKNCVLSESNFFRTFVCCSTLTALDLSRSDIVTLPPCIRRFVRLKALYLNGCKAIKEILGLPPNVKRVAASGCVSLAIFLEEDRRFQFQVPALILGDNVLIESDFLIQRECPLKLEYLDLSGSAIVSLPTWFNKFVGLESLHLISCKQLREIPKLPPNIISVQANGCTSLERFQYNNINDLPMLQWIDFSDCLGSRENMGDDLQIRLRSEVRTSVSHIYLLLCVP
jgi:Leucine-rich repeat (LRR) protein